MYNGIEIIAEVKTESPSGFKSNESWDELFDIANLVGDKIAIHTNQRWGGHSDLITKAKNHTSKKILAKNFHTNDDELKKAFEDGADYALVVGRIPGFFDERCIIEPTSLDQLYDIKWGYKVVWNARDLSNLIIDVPKRGTFEEARKIWLPSWLCQASYIRTVDDIKPGATAVLVGSHLKEFARSMGYSC